MKIENIIIMGAFAAAAFLLLRTKTKSVSASRTAAGPGGYYDGVTIGSQQARMLASQDVGLW